MHLIRRKHKRVYNLNFNEQLLILGFANTWCLSNSAFFLLFGIPIGIESYAVGLKICAITAGIKNYKSMIKKKRKKTIVKVLLKNY